jgi:hypothetical protein
VTNSQSGSTPLLSVATLAPRATASFTGSYLVLAAGPTTSTSTARATSLCGASIAGSAGSTCTVIDGIGLTPTVVNGVFKLSVATKSGKSYTIQYKNMLSDPAWTNLSTITGTGGSMSVTDPTAAQQPRRFYRVMSTP